MIISVAAANEIFDILVATGNFDDSNKDYMDYKREEFIQQTTENDGVNEYWYSSKCGASLKLYFQQRFITPFTVVPQVTFVAQTFNPIKEKNIVANMNEALNRVKF